MQQSFNNTRIFAIEMLKWCNKPMNPFRQSRGKEAKVINKKTKDLQMSDEDISKVV